MPGVMDILDEFGVDHHFRKKYFPFWKQILWNVYTRIIRLVDNEITKITGWPDLVLRDNCPFCGLYIDYEMVDAKNGWFVETGKENEVIEFQGELYLPGFTQTGIMTCPRCLFSWQEEIQDLDIARLNLISKLEDSYHGKEKRNKEI